MNIQVHKNAYGIIKVKVFFWVVQRSIASSYLVKTEVKTLFKFYLDVSDILKIIFSLKYIYTCIMYISQQHTSSSAYEIYITLCQKFPHETDIFCEFYFMQMLENL